MNNREIKEDAQYLKKYPFIEVLITDLDRITENTYNSHIVSEYLSGLSMLQNPHPNLILRSH